MNELASFHARRSGVAACSIAGYRDRFTSSGQHGLVDAMPLRSLQLWSQKGTGKVL
jgi:hypothetical protein